jgi:hypothetical protein
VAVAREQHGIGRSDLAEDEERQQRDQAEGEEAAVAQHGTPAVLRAGPPPLAGVRASGPREEAEGAEDDGAVADLSDERPAGRPGTGLFERQEHEDQVDEAAGAGEDEERRQRRAGGDHGGGEERTGDEAGPEHEAHQAVALGPEARADEVGDHSVARGEVERPADAAVDEDEHPQRPEAVGEGEAHVGDRLRGGAGEHHGAAAVAVAQAAGEGLQRQSGERRRAHDEADGAGGDLQPALEQQRRVGKRETDRDEVQQRARHEEPEATGEQPELTRESAEAGMARCVRHGCSGATVQQRPAAGIPSARGRVGAVQARGEGPSGADASARRATS